MSVENRNNCHKDINDRNPESVNFEISTLIKTARELRVSPEDKEELELFVTKSLEFDKTITSGEANVTSYKEFIQQINIVFKAVIKERQNSDPLNDL